MMKKLLLSILSIIAVSSIATAQDSTAFVSYQFENLPPPIGLVPASYASVQTLNGSNLRITGDWTIEAWIKIGFANIHSHIVETYGSGSTGGFVLRLEGKKVMAYQIASPSSKSFAIGTTVIPTNEWHHIAATLNETTQELKVYLDGELEGTTSTTITTSNTNNGLYIGARGDDQQVSGSIEIDDVRIWDIARTGSEILADTLGCFTGTETGLLAMYDFEDVTGPALVDKTQNGNTGNFISPNFTSRIYTCHSIVLVNTITVQGQAGDSTITTSGGTLQMEGDVLPINADDDSYTWSVLDGTGSATISASGLLTATADGTVTVTAIANDGSGVSSSVTSTISNQSVGIHEVLSQNLGIYPNPAKNQISFDTTEKIESISIINISGKRLGVMNSANNIVDISSLVKGIYFLQIQTEYGVVTNKFIKK
jgi:uncharacterized protein YjdB